MNTGEGRSAGGDVEKIENGDSITLVIKRDAIEDFIITYDFTSDVNEEPVAGHSIELFQNMPNPFTNSTDINFSLPYESKVSIEIFDALGSKVANFSGNYRAGMNTIKWNGTTDNGAVLSTGMYVVRLSSGSVSMTRQMMLIR
jgi:hypothetical protein